MARELSEFPQTRGRKSGGSKYPLDEWLNGKILELTFGEDYHCQPENLRATLSKAAKDRGGKVRTALVNDKKSLVVQFVKNS